MKHFLPFFLAVVWLCSACQTLQPTWLLSLENPRIAQVLEALERNGEERQSLRAVAKLSIDGPQGSGRAKQVMLVERPSRLRVEVFGLLGQVVSLLVTDGEQFVTYDARKGAFETGEVHPTLLRNVAGIDLLPEEAVRVLLAAPALPQVYQVERAERLRGGGLALEIMDPWGEGRRRFEFDAEDRLTRTVVTRGEGEIAWEALFSDFRSLSESDPKQAFPYQIEVLVPTTGVKVKVRFSDLELNPPLDDNLFHLEVPAA